MKLAKAIVFVVFFVAALSIIICYTVKLTSHAASPCHAYIVDANSDGIPDVKVVAKNGKGTILYGTKGTKMFRLKDEIMEDFRGRMEELEKEEGKKYR